MWTIMELRGSLIGKAQLRDIPSDNPVRFRGPAPDKQGRSRSTFPGALQPGVRMDPAAARTFAVIEAHPALAEAAYQPAQHFCIQVGHPDVCRLALDMQRLARRWHTLFNQFFVRLA